jgi:hypothetical protein
MRLAVGEASVCGQDPINERGSERILGTYQQRREEKRYPREPEHGTRNDAGCF